MKNRVKRLYKGGCSIQKPYQRNKKRYYSRMLLRILLFSTFSHTSELILARWRVFNIFFSKWMVFCASISIYLQKKFLNFCFLTWFLFIKKSNRLYFGSLGSNSYSIFQETRIYFPFHGYHSWNITYSIRKFIFSLV